MRFGTISASSMALAIGIAFSGCSDGHVALPPAPVASPAQPPKPSPLPAATTSPSAAPTATSSATVSPPAVTPLPSTSPTASALPAPTATPTSSALTATPSTLVFPNVGNRCGPNGTSTCAQTFVAAESNYSGVLSATSANPGVATVSPAQGNGPSTTFTVVPIAAGTTTITVMDSKAQTTSVTVTVTAPASGAHFYVSVGGEIDVYDSNGSRTNPTIPSSGAGLDDPWGPAVDANGKIYVANSNGNTVTSYDANGARTAPTIDLSSSGSQLPRSIAVGLDGKIYVQQVSGNSQILTFGPDGKQIAPTISTHDSGDPSAYGYHNGIAVGPNGTIYAAFLNGSTGSGFEAFDSLGNRILVVNMGFRSAVGIAVDRNNKIYVADPQGNQILTFDASGARTSPTITNGLHYPLWVAVDNVGKIYVANSQNGSSSDPPSSNNVTVYDSAGNLLGPPISIDPGMRGLVPRGIAVR